MTSRGRSLVTFTTSEFALSADNSEPLGRGLALWLVNAVKAKGCLVPGLPEQEDFGWYFDFEVGEVPHCFVLGGRVELGGEITWIANVERRRRFLSSVFGGRKRGIRSEALVLMNEVVRSIPSVSSVAWHVESAFDRGDESQGADSPLAP